MNRARQATLGDAGVGFDQQQDTDPARGHFADAGGVVAEHRLLGEAQPVAEQTRQRAGAQRFFTAHFVWVPNNLIPS